MGDNKCGNGSHRCLATVSCLSTVFASCCNYLTKRSIKWPKTRKEEANAPIGRSKSTWWNWLDSCQQRAADLHKLSDLIASNVNILLWNQFQCVCVCVCVCAGYWERLFLLENYRHWRSLALLQMQQESTNDRWRCYCWLKADFISWLLFLVFPAITYKFDPLISCKLS